MGIIQPPTRNKSGTFLGFNPPPPKKACSWNRPCVLQNPASGSSGGLGRGSWFRWSTNSLTHWWWGEKSGKETHTIISKSIKKTPRDYSISHPGEKKNEPCLKVSVLKEDMLVPRRVFDYKQEVNRNWTCSNPCFITNGKFQVCLTLQEFCESTKFVDDSFFLDVFCSKVVFRKKVRYHSVTVSTIFFIKLLHRNSFLRGEVIKYCWWFRHPKANHRLDV